MTELEKALRELLNDVANLSYGIGYNDALDLNDMTTEALERDTLINRYANGLKNMIQSGGTRIHDAGRDAESIDDGDGGWYTPTDSRAEWYLLDRPDPDAPLVERVAEAICNNDHSQETSFGWAVVGVDTKDAYRDNARAALSAPPARG